jgi:AsmA family protein
VHRPSSLRSWRLTLAIALGLLLGALALGEALQWPFLRAPLQDALSRNLQRSVTLQAPFGVRLFGSLQLRSALLVIGPPEGAPPQPDLARATDIRLTVPYTTLWHAARGHGDRPPVIDTLTVAHLDAHLLRDAQGRSNWQLGRAPTADRNAPSSALPRFGLLQMRSGEIDLDDALLPLTLRASVRTQEGSAPAQSGTPQEGLQVQARGHYRKLPLTADLQSSGVLPWLRSDGATNPVPLRLDLRLGRALLKLDGQAIDLLQLGGLDAAVELSAPSLAAVGDALGLTLPTTAAFDLRGRVRKEGNVWATDIASWRVGTSRLRGDFRYDTASEPPLLTGTLAGERLALADLGPAIGTRTAAAPEGKAANSNAAAAGRVLPQREFDIPSLQRMSANVLLRLDRLDLGTPQLESLAPLQGRIRLQRGVLGVQELLARSASGTVRGEITVDARTLQAPQWRADLRWSGIELERFIKARNDNVAAATATSAPGYVSGTLGGSANLTGRGRSVAAVMATLDGKAGLWVRDGSVSHLLTELAGIDLAESLGVLIKGDERLPLRCAMAQWNLRDGTARPEAALIDTRDTTLLINGELSLAKESLALVVTAQPHDFSLFTLRSPLRIGGSFGAPQVQLDKSRIALRLAGAAALAAIAPPAALLALVDLGEDDRQQCAEAVERSQAARKAPPARQPKR